MKLRFGRHRRMEGAIRRIDVVVIVTIVVVLAALGVFSVGHLQERARRLACRDNLQRIGTALQLYARDNNGLLPDCSRSNPQFAGPAWPWDMHTNLSDSLMTKGLTRPMFYCPANPQMDDDRHWNFWKQVPGPVRVVGYGFLFEGVRQVPPTFWCAKLSGKDGLSPTETELGFDATACVNNDYAAITGIFVDRSNHMRGKKPLGGNVLFLDSHAEWRNFREMTVRFNTIGPGGPVLWSF